MKAGRQRSIEETLKRTISEIVRQKLTLNDTDLLSINHVDLRNDGRRATVLISHIHDNQQEDVLDALRDNELTIRKHVMKALPLKRIPELVFEIDPVAEQAGRIEDILNEWRGEGNER